MAYYEALKKRAAAAYKAIAEAQQEEKVDISSCYAPCYQVLHDDLQQGLHEFYYLPGGRGSGKSSFIGLEMVDGIQKDKNANGIIFRAVAATLRDSCYAQIKWAIETLGTSAKWRGSVSPMQFTYLPTGQQILFRGLDDASKLKSIKPQKGYFRFCWFEEFCELRGENQVRSVLQSIMRGGEKFTVFASFNPPMSAASWANKYVIAPNDKAITFRTTYKQMPVEWLGQSFIDEADRLRSVNERAYRHEYLGEAIGTGGEVFPNIETRTITKEEIQQYSYVYCGLDWGFASDPTCYIRCAFDAKHDTILLIDEVYKHRLSNKQIAEELRQHGHDTSSSYYGWEDGTVIYADSAEPKSIADLREMGFDIVGSKKSPGSVIRGIKWLQSRTIIVDPARTPNAHRELTEYMYETTKDGEILASVPDAANHSIDALRYALSPLIMRNSGYSA